MQNDDTNCASAKRSVPATMDVDKQHSDIDKMALEIMEELLKDRHFQALWIHLTEEEFKRALSADPSICPHKTTIDGNESKNLKEESAASEHHQASISSILDDEILDLCAAIQVSVDTFNRSRKLLKLTFDFLYSFVWFSQIFGIKRRQLLRDS